MLLCEISNEEHNSVKFESQYNILIPENQFDNVGFEMDFTEICS